MNKFWLCFVPLFVAVDAIGILPMFMGLTENLEPGKVRRIILQSVLTAEIIVLIFLALGEFILRLLGITVVDFTIAGGLLLFVISLNDIVSVEKKIYKTDEENLGAVPLAVPLMVGPAVLTTTILLVNEHGFVPTVLATVVNILIAGGIFASSGAIIKTLGKAGAKTVSKLASLLLAAIAVMMVRKGIMMLIPSIVT